MLVSQDRQEIFINIATFDTSYMKYISGLGTTDSFLRVQEYGPFDVKDHRHMFYLGRIMLALSLQEGLLS